MFSGTVPDYLFIYVFIYFQKYRNVVFRHCALCKTGSSQCSVFETVKNILNKYKYCEQTLFLPLLLHIGLHQDIL